MATVKSLSFVQDAPKAEPAVAAAPKPKRERKPQAKTAAPKQAPKAEAKPKRTQTLDGAHAQVKALVEAEAARRVCLCGCGAATPRAFFSPGHDARLVSRFLNA